MNKSKNVKVLIALSAVVCLAAIYLIMFFNVNSRYPQNKRTVYEFGEKFISQNAEITITDTDWLNKADIEQNKELTEILKTNSGYLSEDNFNLALVDMTVKNPTNETIKLDLTAFHFESGAFSLQFYYPLMLHFNDCGMYVELAGGEEKNLKIPIPISSSQFLNYNADNIKNRSYYFVTALYPEKVMAEIKF